MKRFLLLTSILMFFASSSPLHAQVPGGINADGDLRKSSGTWRSKVPYLPMFSWGLSVGFRPNYFSPANHENVQPYVSSGLGLNLRGSLSQYGVTGYWSDVRWGVSWGFSKPLTDNLGAGQQYARRILWRDIGISTGKTLFVEPNTGTRVGFNLSTRIPISLPSRFRTLLSSLGTGISISKRVFGRLGLSYSFGANFNFYEQDTAKYNPDLAGVPRGFNSRWGMSHSFGAGFSIIRGLSVSAGLFIGVGYSFADAYATVDGPQVFGGENMTAADRASYAINEGNFYGVSIGLSYTLIPGVLSIGARYSNSGAQFERQWDNQGKSIFVLRNPFKLQNGSFGFSLGGAI